MAHTKAQDEVQGVVLHTDKGISNCAMQGIGSERDEYFIIILK